MSWLYCFKEPTLDMVIQGLGLNGREDPSRPRFQGAP